MDRTKYQYEGLKWLVELELLNHPQAINTLKLNIMMASPRIKEVELLIYREQKSMLVLLDLTWIGKTFFKKQIFIDVQEALVQLLPSFKFRVTDDHKIMELAIERVKQALTGGKNENATDRTNGVVGNSDKQPSSSPESTKSTGTSESTEANQEKQPDSSESILQVSSSTNSGEEPVS